MSSLQPRGICLQCLVHWTKCSLNTNQTNRKNNVTTLPPNGTKYTKPWVWNLPKHPNVSCMTITNFCLVDFIARLSDRRQCICIQALSMTYVCFSHHFKALFCFRSNSQNFKNFKEPWEPWRQPFIYCSCNFCWRTAFISKCRNVSLQPAKCCWDTHCQRESAHHSTPKHPFRQKCSRLWDHGR